LISNREGTSAVGLALRGVVVAKVVKVDEHPAADLIWLARVTWDPAERQEHQVVFGGELKLKPGDLVPAAPPGSRLGERKRMRTRTYRGQRSHGMLCSTDELGWTVSGDDRVAVLRQESGFAVGASLDAVAFSPGILVSDIAVGNAEESSAGTPELSGAGATPETFPGHPPAGPIAPNAGLRPSYGSNTTPSPAEPARAAAVGA
jgi:tRNA-binding EMAP/Myf-like protein